jgi:hypothetical protein
MDELLTGVLEASIANPHDKYEVDIVADVASVGLTDTLFNKDLKIDWTEDMLESAASTLMGMPINMKAPAEDGKIDPHTNIAIGRVDSVSYDKSRQRLLAKGKLWKHYFPETIKELEKMHADKKAQVSIEFQPTEADFPEDGVIRPTAGRFLGFGVVNKGADKGNFIHLLASAKQEDEERKSAAPVAALPGSFEWIGERLIQHLNASASVDDHSEINVFGTFSDHSIWHSNGTYWQTPFTITDRTNIIFGDTIEVEPDFKPLSAAGPEEPVVEPEHKEAIKPMAEIADTELETLKASAAKATDLEKELETLRAAVAEKDKELEAANEFKTTVEQERETARLEKLAASRVEEIEKIREYDDDKQKTEAAEAFKTMDEKQFEAVKTLLQASAGVKGGVREDATIKNPHSEDADGEAEKFVGSEDYKRLVASASVKEDDK